MTLIWTKRSSKGRAPQAAAAAILTLFVMCTNGQFPLPKSGYMDVWEMCNWGLSYKTGFILRGFIGYGPYAHIGPDYF